MGMLGSTMNVSLGGEYAAAAVQDLKTGLGAVDLELQEENKKKELSVAMSAKGLKGVNAFGANPRSVQL